MSSTKSILVTGATGYLGSHIVKKLLRSNQPLKIIGTTKSIKNATKIE